MTCRPLPRLAAIAFALALPLVLSGCGNKGPLVLPDQVPAETTVPEAVPAEPAPAEPAPPEAPPAEPPPPAESAATASP